MESLPFTAGDQRLKRKELGDVAEHGLWRHCHPALGAEDFPVVTILAAVRATAKPARPRGRGTCR
eukprot:5457871-Pyramimonas_sp.AAC.1